MRNPFKAWLALRAFGTLVRDLNRINEIFNLVDSLVTPESLDGVAATMAKDARCARALEERPRLGTVDFDRLRASPEGTLGRVYCEHMMANGLDHKTLPSRPSPTPREYVLPHFYETHDIWHVVTDLLTDVPGEAALQGFYAAQGLRRAPLSILSAGLLSTAVRDLDTAEVRFRAIVRGWLLGKHAEPLFGIDWKRHWDEPIDLIRDRLRLDIKRVDALLASITTETA